MEESIDPRWFISTKRQRDIAAEALDNEPQQLMEHLYLGSRDCMLNVEKRSRLKQEYNVKSVLMCCDRRPDFPKEFEYYELRVNNESRDSGDQHSRHVHDDDELGGACTHGGGGCGDLHLLRWKVQDNSDAQTCLAQVLCSWIDERIQQGQSVLIHGFDGVTNSPAVAIAYLMWKKKMRLSEACALVEAKRPIVRLTPPILKDLQIWDSRLVQSRTQFTKRLIPKRNGTK